MPGRFNVSFMKIVIANLNSRTTISHLKGLFLPYGRITSVRIMATDEAGRSSCYGIVKIAYRSGMIAIRALDELLFMNRFLEVYEVKE